MNRKFLILLIAIIFALICLSTIILDKSNMTLDKGILDKNPFSDNSKDSTVQYNSDDLTIEFLHIQQVKKAFTDSNGNKRGSQFYLKFTVQSNLDSMNQYNAEVTCFDGDGDVIDTVTSLIDHEGTNKIPLNCGSEIKKAELTVKDISGNEIFRDTTEEVKKLEK